MCLSGKAHDPSVSFRREGLGAETSKGLKGSDTVWHTVWVFSALSPETKKKKSVFCLTVLKPAKSRQHRINGFDPPALWEKVEYVFRFGLGNPNFGFFLNSNLVYKPQCGKKECKVLV